MVILQETGVDLAWLREIGECLASALRPGDVVLLFGPLGAGKTTLVRIVAKSLGVTDAVRSPSFTIANIYAGLVTVNHLDLYRLQSIEEEDALALEEYLTPDAITLVEWPEAGSERLGRPAWTVHLGHESLETRTVLLEAGDEEARARWRAADISGGGA
ncbi:MAG: tRNA (adenosine(37)-N6)-threonylcarbamoyltransferase complex ATPase subunit type 1 TsaE [Actinobacteria bacterium]|nr:tRNA (adenosine(37)-N6)-threonylcarbamoyltransferase complex ATPase subunit type 1 TsaE [Actinomycetota bacterium]